MAEYTCYKFFNIL